MKRELESEIDFVGGVSGAGLSLKSREGSQQVKKLLQDGYGCVKLDLYYVKIPFAISIRYCRHYYDLKPFLITKSITD